MGYQRDGCLVSGINIAIAGSAGPSAPPPAPLQVSITWAGDRPLNVSGASGVAQSKSSPWTPNVFGYLVTGGVPPYSESNGLINNPSGKLFIAAAPDGVHNTIGWSGFSINETESAEIFYTATDSAGTTGSSSDTITVRRIS
jgi:hypothetical protein